MPRRVHELEPLGGPEQHGPALAGEITNLDLHVRFASAIPGAASAMGTWPQVEQNREPGPPPVRPWGTAAAGGTE